MARLLLIALCAALLLVFARWLLTRRFLFVIRVRRAGVILHGRVPAHPDTEVVEFVASLRLPPGSTIRGQPDGRGGFRLLCSSSVPEPLQQRMRNFLYLKP